jgi:hypothetical protein
MAEIRQLHEKPVFRERFKAWRFRTYERLHLRSKPREVTEQVPVQMPQQKMQAAEERVLASGFRKRMFAIVMTELGKAAAFIGGFYCVFQPNRIIAALGLVGVLSVIWLEKAGETIDEKIRKGICVKVEELKRTSNS